MRQVVSVVNFHDEQGKPAGGFVTGTGIDISWQKGPLGRIGGGQRIDPNGAFVEDVLEACLQRLQHYNESGFRCTENDEAIEHITIALVALDKRTQRRVLAEVEGTHEGN